MHISQLIVMATGLKHRFFCNHEGAEIKIFSHPPIPVVLKFGEKRKRPVGRPRKASKQSTDSVVKLVDYSSSEEDDKVEVLKAKKLRKMYSAGQKRKVADYSRHHGVRKAARHFKVSHGNVIRWKKQRVTLLKTPNKRQHKRGQG